MTKIGVDELKVILSQEIQNALGMDGGKLSTERRRLLERYEGYPYGDELANHSHAIDRSVLETIEMVLPQLMDVYARSDTIFQFEPYRPGEEAMAAQATDYCNFIMTRDNPGFEILYTVFKDALIMKNGYLLCHWVEERTSSVSTYTGLSDAEFEQLTNSPDVEVIEDRPYENPDPQFQWFTEDAPEAIVPTLHDCRLRIYQQEGRVKIEAVAPESVIVSRRASDTALDGKHFVGRRELKRRSDLVQMGYDEDLIDEAMGYDEQEWNSERIARYLPDDDWPVQSDRTDASMRECWITEAYLPVDFDNDGVAELRRIVCAGDGNVIFENEEIDDCPLISITPIPMPHKHVGMSLAETVTDIQEQKSFIIRQMLDNLYLTNVPRMIVDENSLSDNSIEDFLNVRPGGLIRMNGIQGATPLAIPFVAAPSMQALEYFDAAKQVRTGVSPASVGLTPDILNNTTATAANLAQNNASRRVELIARLFGEQGVKRLAQRILGLVIKHQQEARIIRLRGQFVQMDVRDWRENMDVTVSVGLGTGNKDQMLSHLMQILQTQQEIVKFQGGVTGPLVTADNIFDVLSKLTENAGFKQSFFSNPQMMPPQPPQPHPEAVKQQQEAAMAQAKLQAQLAAQKQESDLRMQLAQQEFAHKMQLEDADAQHQIQLETQRENFKAKLEIARFAQKASQMAQPQAAPPVGAPVAPPPPVPGARQAPDGRHYLPDPNRPGKYMMVV